MITSIERGIRSLRRPAVQNAITAETVFGKGSVLLCGGASAEQAKRLSAVYACVDIISNSIGKLPMQVIDRKKREIIVDHPLDWLLNVRPNDAMTPTVAKKMMEANRLCHGNGVCWIMRDFAARPIGLLPIPSELLTIFKDASGRVRYHITIPTTGEPIVVDRADVLHVMGPTTNGYSGKSVLSYARDVTTGALAAQEYNKNYYLNGGQPAGVLQTDADLTTEIEKKNSDGTVVKVNLKDAIRESWEAVHSGPTNAQRIAILDYGLKYTPISVSNKDAQFVEQKALSVEDIARFFTMPLYKISAGKQSYSSNEQNSIEYVTETLHPIVNQYEDEYSYKLLPDTELCGGLRMRVDMTEEMRGDFAARASYYQIMRNIGVYSVNDVCRSEYLPDVAGGDERRESLNYVPLAMWPEISARRNGLYESQGGNK